jgi:hypothetical protein
VEAERPRNPLRRHVAVHEERAVGQVVDELLLLAGAPGAQIGSSIKPPQLRHVTFAVSDMRAIVE